MTPVGPKGSARRRTYNRPATPLAVNGTQLGRGAVLVGIVEFSLQGRSDGVATRLLYMDKDPMMVVGNHRSARLSVRRLRQDFSGSDITQEGRAQRQNWS